MKDVLKDYNKLMKAKEQADNDILALLDADDDLEYEEDEELPADYVRKPIEVVPAEPKKREKRVGALIFFFICAFMCFAYAFIFDKAYNDFRPLPVLIGGFFLALGVIVF